MIDARTTVIEIYRALERAAVPNRVERTRKAARAVGISFTNAEAVEWLAPFIRQSQGSRSESLARRENNLIHGRKRGRETDGVADGSLSTKRTESRTRNGRNDGLTRDKGIPSLFQGSTDSLRSSALAFGKWPDDNDGLRELAGPFLARFGNCSSDDAVKKHIAAYVQTLATFRYRGVSIATAWRCCEDALDAEGCKPLFGERIKKALSYIPARPSLQAPQNSPYAGLRVVTQQGAA